MGRGLKNHATSIKVLNNRNMCELEFPMFGITKATKDTIVSHLRTLYNEFNQMTDQPPMSTILPDSNEDPNLVTDWPFDYDNFISFDDIVSFDGNEDENLVF